MISGITGNEQAVGLPCLADGRGRTQQKTRYGRALACAMMDKSLDLPGLGELGDREAKALHGGPGEQWQQDCCGIFI